MLDILGYAVAFATALSVVVMCLEHFAVRRARPRRSAWALAMLFSILLPAMLMLRTRAGSAPLVVVTAPAPVTEAPGPAIATAPAIDVAGGQIRVSSPVGALAADARAKKQWHPPELSVRSFLAAWAAVSGALFAFLAAASLVLRRRAAGWEPESIHGHEVLVSEQTGPALIGVLRPRIVVPRWFLAEPATTRLLILEHERQHMLARDPLLLRAGVLAAIAVPWNLPLWWQLRRLRLTIELDCDARVLRGGADAASYAQVLLGVVQRASAMPVGVVAMTEPASALERRIRNLLAGPRRYALWGLVGASVLAIAGVAVMVALDAPVIPGLGEHRGTLAAVTSAVRLSARPESPPPTVTEKIVATADAGAVGQATGATKPAIAARPAAPASPQLPRLLPPAINSMPERVTGALVQRYPELLSGRERPGIIEATIVLQPDGAVYRSGLRKPRPEAPNGSVEGLSDLIPRDAGAPTTAFLKSGSTVPGGRTLKSNVAVHYVVLPDNYDGSRSVERVQAALVAARPDLLLPDGGDRVNRVTVYMTEDGRIDRLYNEVRLMTDLRPAPPVDPTIWSPIFEPLGLRPEQLGRMGMTYVYADAAKTAVAADGAARAAADRTWMIARYAWPRREGEPTGGFQASVSARVPDTFDAAAALAIVQHYLPDVFAAAPPNVLAEPPPDAGIPAIALSGSGQVLRATRLPTRYGLTPEAVRVLQDQLAPGVRLSRFVARPVTNAEGVGTTVLFAWDVLGASRAN